MTTRIASSSSAICANHDKRSKWRASDSCGCTASSIRWAWRHLVLTLAAMTLVVIGLPTSARAQASATTAGPTFDLGAAYQFMYAGGDEKGQSFPVGLAINAARYWGAVGLAAEGGWAYHSEGFDRSLSPFQGLSAKTNFFHAGVGPRFAARSAGHVRPYVQVLLGVSTTHFSIEDTDSGNTQTAFMIQPGGGVNLVTGDGWGVFGDVAYRRSFFEDSGSNEIRVLVGVRMILD